MRSPAFPPFAWESCSPAKTQLIHKTPICVPQEDSNTGFLVPAFTALVVMAAIASLTGCSKTTDPVCKQGMTCASSTDSARR
jgi:hypothetical protein